MKSVQTGNDGEFSFEGVASGLYFLNLKASGLRSWSGEPITGLIAVAVDQDAPTDHLDLDFGWTSCGLWYVDRNRCPQPDLQLGELSDQVLDASGAAIPRATILLFDHAQKLVARLQSDNAGKFASLESLAGTYELVVSAPGFTPLHGTAHIELRGDSSLRSSLTVQLGLGGTCSSAGPIH
jgi:hypothetical protein